MKVKKCSYPFDWIFSNPNMVIDCITNNFCKFLDRSLHCVYEIHKKNTTNRSGHTVYGKRIFNHHYILNDDTYYYFERCVHRFNILLAKPGRKLFIITFVNRTVPYQTIINDVQNIYDTLNSKTKNFEILCIYHHIGVKLSSYVDNIHNNLKIIEIRTKSPSSGTRITNRVENDFFNNAIYSSYDFDILDDVHYFE